MEAFIQSDVEKLEEILSADWPNIRKAREHTVQGKDLLEDVLKTVSSSQTLNFGDVSIVVFGSLARKEFTSGSDIDWTILVDGQANPQHHDIALNFKNELEKREEIKEPGQEATFGGLAFSHDIIHKIGGGDDTNKNTTQRILLLLESASIGHRHGDSSAYERVMQGVLNRYVLEDRAAVNGEIRLPRFLLNDIVRYWRTMAVDFGYKRRQRQGKGSALRNIKLRLSRKLIYVSGLLACFACEMDEALLKEVVSQDFTDGKHPLVNYLYKLLQLPPLDVIASIVVSHKIESHENLYNSANIVMDNYDKFLGIIDDTDKRNRLKELSTSDMYSDTVYKESKKIGEEFQRGLCEIFFSDNGTKLFSLIKKYGVF